MTQPKNMKRYLTHAECRHCAAPRGSWWKAETDESGRVSWRVVREEKKEVPHD
jgi:hypothetical protein